MNKDIVFNLLNNSKKPLSAYEILHHLRNKGFKAPMSIYRALDILINAGNVHKIDNEKKYVACNHHHKNESLIFTTCKKCKVIVEHHSEKINNFIKQF